MRLLLVEDSTTRYERFCSWLPHDMRITVARCAGAAVGIIERTRPGEYSGMLLDHDLTQQTVTPEGGRFTGTDVVTALMNLPPQERDVPVLVHSANVVHGPAMAQRLAGAGFPVTRIAWSDLTEERFRNWLEEVREFSEGRAEQ